jgi:glycerol transport system ATP-binding protein
VLSGLPDGRHTVAFRADAVTIEAARAGRLAFPGRVAVTEISGSESFVHVDVGFGTPWVCLVRGLHAFEPGDNVEVQVDPAEAFVFAADGTRLRASALAATA